MTCTRQYKAITSVHLQSQVHYCYHCFEWVIGDAAWEDHCRTHLSRLASKNCGTITYCHTVIRPAFCPFHLGDKDLLPSERMLSWTRDAALWDHVVDCHLNNRQWPISCPHPLCQQSLRDRTSLEHHFIDEHNFSRTRPGLGTVDEDSSTQPVRKRKRTSERSVWQPSWEPTAAKTEKSCSLERAGKKKRVSVPPSPLSGQTSESEGAVLPSAGLPTVAPELLLCRQQGTIEKGELWQLEVSCEESDITATDISSHDEDLFSQFLRSPSPTPPPTPPPLPPPSYESRGVAATPWSGDESTTATSESPDELGPHSDGLRLLLRVNPSKPEPQAKPKIVLRLGRPQVSRHPAKRGEKRRTKKC